MLPNGQRRNGTATRIPTRRQHFHNQRKRPISGNFYNVETLRLDNCLKGVCTVLPNSCKDRLTAVEFIGVTLVENIREVLKSCRLLTKMTLTSVAFPDSEDIRSLQRTSKRRQREEEMHQENDTKVGVNLVNITLAGGDKLTTDEAFLLDFLCENFTLWNLRNLAFVKSAEHRSLEKFSEEDMPGSSGSSVEHSTSVALFLLENFQTLKILQVTRNNIRLIPESFKLPSPFLQLVKFSFNMAVTGFQTILNQQKGLRVLECYNHERLSPAAFTSVFVAIDRCRHTLRDIKLEHRYDYDFPSEGLITTEIPRMLQHDCNIYKACTRLQSINLNLTDPDPEGSAEGRLVELVGTNGFPNTLRNLIVRFDYISESAMEALGSHFVNLRHLRHLVFHGNPKYAFTLKSQWIKNLLRLPHMEIFEFHFCEALDAEAVSEMRQSFPNLHDQLKFTPSSCTYWKVPYYE